MPSYNLKTEDGYGRQMKPVLFNTAKDGSGTWYFALVDSSGRIVLGTSTAVIGKVQDDFGGNVYSKTMTMANDSATRFETSTKKLRDVVILVEAFAMLLGETGAEVYNVAVNASVGFTKVDISTLYFKNAVGSGSNGKITIIGMEE